MGDGRDWPRLQDAGPRTIMMDAPERKGRLRWILPLGVAAALAAFGVSLWLASGSEQVASVPPLVRADGAPVKHRPEDPGGMDVPNQGMLVYERMSPGPPSEWAERLLPPPEQPVAKPQPPESDTALNEQVMPFAEDDAADNTVAAAVAVDPAATSALAVGTSEIDEAVAAVTAQAPDAVSEDAAGQAAEPPRMVDVATSDGPVPAQKPRIAAARPPATERPAAAPAPSGPAASSPEPVPVVTAAGGAGLYRIQLASFSDESGAQLAWKQILSAHAGVLDKLRPVVVRVELSRGVRYRLQAGAFMEADKAERACTALKARKQDCLVVSGS